MITSTDLELKSTLTLGTLESNAESINAFVLERIKDYTPDKYVGKVKEAKDDRAVLNNAAKTLNARRLELERQYMEPFNKFKSIISDTCKAINEASGKLDEIVKGEEEREKSEKQKDIQKYWDSTGFSLCELSKVFDQKWLNKGTKLKDVQDTIDQIQTKIFADLKILEQFPSEDVPLLKTEYLNTLDITDAMEKANQLKANREKLAKEKIEREAIEQKKACEQQFKAETEEMNNHAKEEAVDDLASQALGLEIKPEDGPKTGDMALLFHGTVDQFIALKRDMTTMGITYKKLVDKGNGVYTVE